MRFLLTAVALLLAATASAFNYVAPTSQVRRIVVNRETFSVREDQPPQQVLDEDIEEEECEIDLETMMPKDPEKCLSSD